jgi:hypothetical protein
MARRLRVKRPCRGSLPINNKWAARSRLPIRRTADFRRGQRLGPDDHLILWTKPPRPDWMDEQTYATIPDTLTLREMRYYVVVPGRRVQVLTVVTTLLDVEAFSRKDIAELYGFRWNSELDIRSIKQALNLAHARCKSPEMVRRELWTTLLGYNLIRTTAAAAAALHDRQPRQISFTGTCLHAGLVADLLNEPNPSRRTLLPLPQAAGANCRMRSGQPPRSHRAARTQTPTPRLQTDAGTPGHTPRTPGQTQLTATQKVTIPTVPFAKETYYHPWREAWRIRRRGGPAAGSGPCRCRERRNRERSAATARPPSQRIPKSLHRLK